jgi:DNA-binding transcriptional regulator YdaS (Cro superfamily)
MKFVRFCAGRIGDIEKAETRGLQGGNGKVLCTDLRYGVENIFFNAIAKRICYSGAFQSRQRGKMHRWRC